MKDTYMNDTTSRPNYCIANKKTRWLRWLQLAKDIEMYDWQDEMEALTMDYEPEIKKYRMGGEE